MSKLHAVPATIFAVYAILAALAATPGSAITNGVPDADGHPFVLVLKSPTHQPGGNGGICTGSLIAPRVVLTAAHCLFFVEANGFTAADIEVSSTPDFYDTTLTVWHAVTAGFYHPEFDVSRTFENLRRGNDVALLVLAEPLAGVTPVRRAELGLLDTIVRSGELREDPGNEKPPLRRVGYGMTNDFPPAISFGSIDGVRKVTETTAWGIGGNLVHANQNVAAGNGGVCSGDSGGPVLWDDPATDEEVVVGLTSWGDLCVGHNGNPRVDTPVTWAFLEAVIACVDDGLCG